MHLQCCRWSLSSIVKLNWKKVCRFGFSAFVSGAYYQMAPARWFLDCRLYWWKRFRLADGNWFVLFFSEILIFVLRSFGPGSSWNLCGRGALCLWRTYQRIGCFWFGVVESGRAFLPWSASSQYVGYSPRNSSKLIFCDFFFIMFVFFVSAWIAPIATIAS